MPEGRDWEAVQLNGKNIKKSGDVWRGWPTTKDSRGSESGNQQTCTVPSLSSPES